MSGVNVGGAGSRTESRRTATDTPDDEAIVAAALVTLPQEQRAAVELQLAGWPGEQITAALNRSPQAVRMLLYRAITRLRDILADDLSTGGRR